MNQQLQRVDGIAYVGSTLGQVLAAVGLQEQAIPVLERAAAAFEIMQDVAQVSQLRQIANQLRDA